MQGQPSTEQIEAVREYLGTRAWRRGAQSTADRYGVSRSTLWRFLWTEHVSPTLVAAVTAEAGGSTWELRLAAKRLRPLSGAAGANRPRPRLTSADKQTIEAPCHTPLATVDEMAALVKLPANTLRERLARLARKGLADSRPHRLQLLSARPHRRFFPTLEGIVALASGERAGTERLLRLPSRGTIGLVRQGPMLTNASLRYRIRTIERMVATERPLLTLILTESEQDMRRVLRAIADA